MESLAFACESRIFLSETTSGYCISSNDKWHKSAPASAAVCRLHTPGARELCQCTECGSNTSLTPETATTHYANSLAFFALHHVPALRAPALVYGALGRRATKPSHIKRACGRTLTDHRSHVPKFFKLYWNQFAICMTREFDFLEVWGGTCGEQTIDLDAFLGGTLVYKYLKRLSQV